MMVAMSGEIVGRQVLTMEDGMGSRTEVEFILAMMGRSSRGETEVNCDRG